MENRPASDETEITILEYLKSLLARGAGQGQGSVGAAAAEETRSLHQKRCSSGEGRGKFSWFSTGAALLALIAQLFAVNRMALFSLLFLPQRLPVCCWVCGQRSGSFRSTQVRQNPGSFSLAKHKQLFPGLALGAAAFFLFRLAALQCLLPHSAGRSNCCLACVLEQSRQGQNSARPL